jgi:hypothetical protein
MSEIIAALDFLEKHGLKAIPILFACLSLLVCIWLLQVLFDEDRADIFRARMYKWAYKLTGRIEQEKKYIASDIRGRLNLARRNLCPTGTAPCRAVDVTWVDGADGEISDINDGQFVVRMDPGRAQEKNIAILATAVVKRTVLVGIRHSVEPPLQTAIDLNLVRKLLEQAGNHRALDWFFSNEYQPGAETNSSTQARNSQIVAIDERGLFTNLLLVELEDFAKRVYGLAPKAYMAGEIEGLVDFLYKLATKVYGEEVPLMYERAFTRIGVIIVAKTEKLLKGVEPYVRAMEVNLRKEMNAIYVLAFDKEWLGQADRDAQNLFHEQMDNLGKELGARTVVKSFEVEYPCVYQGSRRKARCVRYVARPS